MPFNFVKSSQHLPKLAFLHYLHHYMGSQHHLQQAQEGNLVGYFIG